MSYVIKKSNELGNAGIELAPYGETESIEAGVEKIASDFSGWSMYWERDSDGFDAADVFIYKGAMSHVFSIEKAK